MRSANPTLGKNAFAGFANMTGTEAMTVDGTVNKAFIMLILVLIPAGFVWTLFGLGTEFQGIFYLLLFTGLIVGFIFALITAFKKEWAQFTAPIYAVFEGLFIGGVSVIFERMFPGIVIQAVALTFGVLFLLLLAYKAKILKATRGFKLGIIIATGAIVLVYVASMVMGMFGSGIPYIHESGPIGIAFSLIVVTIAALNLILDFDFIEKGANEGAPRFMEWYAAFGLMVTLVWLYIEILHLLAKIQSRD